MRDFEEEYKRINAIRLGKGGGWKNYSTIGHIKSEADKYFAHLINHFKNRPIRYLEIGTLKGGSFVLTGHVLNVVQAVGVDYGSYRLQKEYDSIQSAQALSPEFQWDIVLGDSHDFKVYSRVVQLCGKFDLIFIDGDHSYKGVKQDFETYGKLIAPNGLIAFHDIYNDAYEVCKFWNEIKICHNCIEFIDKKKKSGDRAGIGII